MPALRPFSKTSPTISRLADNFANYSIRRSIYELRQDICETEPANPGSADPGLRGRSDLQFGREVVVNDQRELALGVPALRDAVGVGRVLEVEPLLHGDRQRTVVEPGGQPDQPAAPWLPVVLLPAHSLPVRRIGVHRGGDERPVTGGA